MAYKIILWIDAGVGRLLPPQLKTYYNDLPFTIPGLGVVVLIVSMIVIGMFAAGFVGRFFIRLGDWIVKKCRLFQPYIHCSNRCLKLFFQQKPGFQPGCAAGISAQGNLDFGVLSVPKPAAKSKNHEQGNVERFYTDHTQPDPPAF